MIWRRRVLSELLVMRKNVGVVMESSLPTVLMRISALPSAKSTSWMMTSGVCCLMSGMAFLIVGALWTL